MNAIARGIETAARDTATETILIGRFSQTIRSCISNHRHIAWLPRDQLRHFLSTRPCIAVAPLPVGLRGDQQQFVNCKSDIKVAEYGSLGIPALFSAALPYVQSDLPRSLVPTNDASEWRHRVVDAASRFPRERPSNAMEDKAPTRPPNAVAPQLLEIKRGERCAHPIQIKTGFPTPPVLRAVDKLIRTITLNWKAPGRLGKTPRGGRSPSAAS
jgi:hypothetical protein